MSKGQPMYDGDSVIRRPISADIAKLDAIEREARALRGKVLGELVQRFFNWAERTAWKARQRDYTTALSRATDHADLERRMKALHQPTATLAG